MGRNLVSCFVGFFDYRWVLRGPIALHEEGHGDISLGQLVQKVVRIGAGTVVKGDGR